MTIHKRAKASQDRFGPIKDFMTQFMQLVPNWLTLETIDFIQRDWGYFSHIITKLFDRYRIFPIMGKHLTHWENFYKKYFPEINLDLTGIRIPINYFDRRVLVIAKGLTERMVWEALERRLNLLEPPRFYLRLDDPDCLNERDPNNGTYAISISDVNPIDKFRGYSSQDLWRRQILTQTRLEHLFYLLVYYHECEMIVGLDTLVICPGTRYTGEDGVQSVATVICRSPEVDSSIVWEFNTSPQTFKFNRPSFECVKEVWVLE